MFRNSRRGYGEVVAESLALSASKLNPQVQCPTMTSSTTADEVLEKETKPTNNDTTLPTIVKKAGFTEKQKEINSGESLPGWTIMRPLRKRGNKSSANGSSAAGIDSKTDSDLKITETNGTNDSGNGVGEIEALHDLRSDDELLGDEEEGRATQGNGNPSATLQTADGTTEQDLVNGGGEYKVYKRRWFGLFQLVLLNIIVSWDVRPLHLAQAALWPRTHTDMSLYSGSPSLRVRLRYPNTMLSPSRPSIGSVPGFCSHSLLYHLL